MDPMTECINNIYLKTHATVTACRVRNRDFEKYHEGCENGKAGWGLGSSDGNIMSVKP